MESKKIFNNRFGAVILFSLLFIVISFLVRSLLLILEFSEIDFSLILILKLYTYGIFYDIIALSYFISPFLIYLLIIPNRIFNSKIHQYISYLFFILCIGILIFSSIGEYFFWEEFGVRYNFIAVDYLVYTHEVIANIRESYPMPIIIIGMLIVSMLIFLCLKKYFDASMVSKTQFIFRLEISLLLLTIPVLSFFYVDKDTLNIERNNYSNELAHNGIYQIFAAFRNNELDYKKFYMSISDKKAFSNLRKLIKTKNSNYLIDTVFDIRRKISYNEPEKHYNIMMITVESLSASFLSRFGSKYSITPNLDSLIKQSLFFNNFYATGTRTVRGMEALSLSLPPTPGYSIVKRPKNENMFSLGNVLKSKGYENNFIYAGNGYFDNMNYFFSNNGYSIIDKSDFEEDEISFENAWGVCDEDLFSKAIKAADESFANGNSFHNFIMTTSNHRPYTYPDGKIDIPSHTGRKGAVKYTDYAIGQFIKKAKAKEWFKNTIFVIVADHCASSAGKTDLPVEKYHIPLIVYAPSIIQAKEINYLSCQIDFAPTILGILKMDYVSKFFGKDILVENPNRALFGTYQKIALYENNMLTIQMPVAKCKNYKVINYNQQLTKINNHVLVDAISYYQSASYLFRNKRYNFN
ncbi:MAG: LTA synthase family protein [Marinifilaceae bacterium]|jgi:phosphoglycerol transferase MdoB-like AlkP superfamily enzyme|nr:LTA synthase family protein [Marinifilaceae bacterium]